MLPIRSLFVCATLLACSKPSPPTDIEPAVVASTRPADGVVVRRFKGKCSRVPCAVGQCEVSCLPQSEMLRVDIAEPLWGPVSVQVEGLEAWSGQTESSMIGLMASVDVRPLKWPANVVVRVGERSGAVQVERSRPFVRTHAAASGPLLFDARAERFMYE